MWKFKNKEYAKQYKKEKMAEIIGLNPDTVRRIINGKQECSKLVAYSITKFLNNNLEIDDFFIRTEERRWKKVLFCIILFTNQLKN